MPEGPAGQGVETSKVVNETIPESRSDVDFGPYMQKIQRRIKRAWFPPRENTSSRIRVTFNVHKDGHVTDLRIMDKGPSAEMSAAAMTAVSNASPFDELPNGARPSVNIEFTFDYNVFNSLSNTWLTNPEVKSLNVIADKYSDTWPEIVNTQHAPIKTETSEGNASLSNYLDIASAKIKKNWYVPGTSGATPERVTFTINKNGTTDNLWLGLVTGDNPADLAVLSAVERSAPLITLPEQAGQQLKAQLRIIPGKSEYPAKDAIFELTTNPAQRTDQVTLASGLSHLSKLSQLIFHCPAPPHQDAMTILVGLDKNGQIRNLSRQPQVAIFRSSLDKDFDQFALTCVKKAAPFDLGAFNNIDGAYLVCLDLREKSAMMTPLSEARCHSIEGVLKNVIVGRWSPPPCKDIENMTVTLTLHRDGTITALKPVDTKCSTDFSKAVMTALTDCVPLTEIPSDAPDQISVRCTFSYRSSGVPATRSQANDTKGDGNRAKQSLPLMPAAGVANAIDEYKKATEAREIASVHEKLADVFRMRMQDDQAIDELKAAIRLHECANLEMKLAQTYLSANKPEAAVAAYERARRMLPCLSYAVDIDNDLAALAAVSLFTEGAQAIKRNPDDPKTHLDYAIELEMNAEYDKARTELIAAIERSPLHKNPKAQKLLDCLPAAAAVARTFLFLDLGEYEHRQGHYQAAVVAYDKAQKYVDRNDSKQQAMIFTTLSKEYESLDDFARAKYYKEKALKLDPSLKPGNGSREKKDKADQR